jgi:peptidoglycan/xylan/chitin deacetylase (PgdA/CDA1 family)
MYHRIGEPLNGADSKYCVRPADFNAHVHALAAYGYTAIAMDSFFAWLGGHKALPHGAFVLTFDDGFRGVREHAWPVLRRLDWPFTVFLVSGFIGGRDCWNGGRRTGTSDLLARDEILEMAQQGVGFESHTCTHPRLPALSDSQLTEELSVSKSEIESLVGRTVRYLAYPFGESSSNVVAATRGAGYEAAFSVQAGFNRPGVDRYQIRRIDVFGSDSPAQLIRKITLGANDGSFHALVHYLGRRFARRVWR